MFKNLVLFIIRQYQLNISSLLGSYCRFSPSCSHYFHESVSTYGFLKGTSKGLLRIVHCHPLSPGGFDPVTK